MLAVIFETLLGGERGGISSMSSSKIEDLKNLFARTSTGVGSLFSLRRQESLSFLLAYYDLIVESLELGANSNYLY